MPVFALLYLVVVLVPLAAVVAGGMPASQAGPGWVLAMAVGFAGLSLMGAQGALTARFRRLSTLAATDRIYAWHQRLGVVAALAVLAHPVILILDEPDRLIYLSPIGMPGYMVAGQVSVVLLAVLVLTSVARRGLRLSYEVWRGGHDALAAGAIILAVVHVDGVRYYLGPAWKHGVWLGAAALWLGLIVFTRLVRPWRLSRHPYRVVAVTPDRGDAWVVAVEPVGHAGITFRAGQFAWLTLGASPFGLGDHPFSFSSAPGLPGGRLEFTIKALGDFTRTVGGIAPGTRAYVDGPYGGFTLAPGDTRGIVCVAGGIGIAPMLSLLRALADAGDRRPHLLIHAGSAEDRLTGADAVDALRARLNLTVVDVLETPDAAWTGERGLITREVLDRHLPADRRTRQHYVCGPPGMIRAVGRHLRALGVPAGQVHAELFEMF